VKTYGGVSSILLNLSTRWKWTVSFTPLPLCPQENSPPHPLYRRLGGSQSRSGHYGEENNLLPLQGIEPRLLRRPVHSLVASELSLKWVTEEDICTCEGESIGRLIKFLSEVLHSLYIGFIRCYCGEIKELVRQSRTLWKDESCI
jgi:hypothetical protein